MKPRRPATLWVGIVLLSLNIFLRAVVDEQILFLGVLSVPLALLALGMNWARFAFLVLYILLMAVTPIGVGSPLFLIIKFAPLVLLFTPGSNEWFRAVKRAGAER